ncbi:uncharacterized protein LOC112573751 [Pomacea canaliculata]|uniref:uncharacterized protein LOC112573751 n=1 Tax=Pomacea canaliculata TaxID=400727 RepID=UPI000D72D4AC|nr:uncharacterized protein LOC112573751 [Pomacea canaliculata]
MDDKLKMDGRALPRNRTTSGSSFFYGRRAGHSNFRGPPPVHEPYTQWTQFSGMPTHSGSPSSLQQVLDSLDTPDTSSGYLFKNLSTGDGLHSTGVLPSGSVAASHFENTHINFSHSSCQPQMQYSEQGWGMNELPQTSRCQAFECGSPAEVDFSMSRCQHLPSHSHSAHIPTSHPFPFPGMSSAVLPCSPAADQHQVLHADFSQPPPSSDYFRTVIDFSRPPPPMKDVAFHTSPLDHHTSLHPEYLRSGSQHNIGSAVSGFPSDARPTSQWFGSEIDQSLDRDLPESDDCFRSDIGVNIPPRFSPFMGVGEGLHGSEPKHTFVSDSVPCSPGFQKAPRKITRQYSEPVTSTVKTTEEEAAYVEVVERSNSFGPSCEQLKQAEDAQKQKDRCTENPASSTASECLPNKPVRSVASRPSYSDVAKSTKMKNPHQKTDCLFGKEREEAEHVLKRKSLETAPPKPFFKPSQKSQVHSKSSTRTRPVSSDTSQNFTLPHSKYGLDQFEDMASSLSRGGSHSSSIESLTSQHHHHKSRSPITILNNGKPNNTSIKVAAAAHKKADYINNDLRETGSSSSSKRTNQTAALNRQSASTAEENQDRSFLDYFDWVLIDEWLKYFAARGQISWVQSYLCCPHLAAVPARHHHVSGDWHDPPHGSEHQQNLGTCKVKLFKVDVNSQGADGWNNGFDSRRRSGLEENIALPATGEEAMKRLLACKGKDPYSILGLRSDATDEDIKRYYRKQAVLVHPDKNQEPGAEEAFKILGHAFEMIGEPAKRKQYDAHILEATEAEAAMREFSDLLTKLQEKIQEAANMMRCEHCGGKHKRIPVDRPWCSARYCDRCNIHHTAKEGDVWAETSMLGFLWHYYACMEGKVYDITEWVSCQRDSFKHMKANAHPVFYRIQTDGNRRHRTGQSGEAHLEDFINQLFNKASMQPDGFSHPEWHSGTGNQSAWTGPSAGNAKRSRRRKRKN